MIEKRWSAREFNFHQENIFQLINPENFHCTVEYYNSSMPHMSIILRRKAGYEGTRELIKLVFRGIHYFQGPIHWHGANFKIAGAQELAELTVRLNYAPRNEKKLEPDKITQVKPANPQSSARIFIVDAVNYKVKIMASRVNYTQS